MDTFDEPTTVGLTSEGKTKLRWLKDQGFFHEQLDAYKIAICHALSCNVDPGEKIRAETIFNIGTLDPDKDLYEIVRALRIAKNEPVYKTMEKLAEWGVSELYSMAQEGNIDFCQILRVSHL